MAANAFVRARVNEKIKSEAASVLADMGLTVSDVVRMVLARVARERALPFELTPNHVTRETLERSARGEEVHRASEVEGLFEDLDI